MCKVLAEISIYTYFTVCNVTVHYRSAPVLILTDEELPRATNTSALSGAGVMRLFNKVGETVNKITYKMDENDTVSKSFFVSYNYIHRIFNQWQVS